MMLRDEIATIPKEVISQLIDDAIEYCNKNHKGGDAKYRAAFDSYMEGATQVILHPEKYKTDK